MAEGEDVEECQAVRVQEAMKMENDLRTDRAGVVKTVQIVTGQEMEKDEGFIEIAQCSSLEGLMAPCCRRRNGR